MSEFASLPLLAKSERTKPNPRKAESLKEHTAKVIRAAEALVRATGEAQLIAIGLDPGEWHVRFLQDMRALAILHDLGKANSHFQKMIRSGQEIVTQGLRHEAVSYLIVRRPEFREWLKPVFGDGGHVDLALWSIAGHHLKFPPADRVPDGAGLNMRVMLNHVGFRQTLDLGEGIGLPSAPVFSSEKIVQLEQAYDELFQSRLKAQERFESLSGEDRRYLAVLKACLICADVAGSIGMRGKESMADWIPKAFSRVPESTQLESIARNRLKAGESFRPFQEEVASREDPVVFVKAGCGTGKTLAAYLWASHVSARMNTRRRLFVCYPTTGTATEGYRDYLSAPELGAELIHGRSQADRELESLFISSVPDADLPQLGSDEPESSTPGERPANVGRTASLDSAGALEQWSTPIVCCTVDTVLGLVQNNRRGLFAWPSIAGSSCVFDEIHSYDDAMFEAFLRFLQDLPGIPCLLMTASLPDDRLERLRNVLATRRKPIDLRPIPGPSDLETVPRYQRIPCNTIRDAWDRVEWSLSLGAKVLWVVNTVDKAVDLANHAESLGLCPILYHSRYKYEDRVRHHRRVVDAFRRADAPSLAITTQVAEMSLDLSANLLVTQLAPVPALIQRLGRLNRRARPDGYSGIRPFLVLPRDAGESPLPYEEADLVEALRWMDEDLGFRPLSQQGLTEKWAVPPRSAELSEGVSWLDGGFVSVPRPLRKSSPGIDVILTADAVAVRHGKLNPERVRIPMPPVPANFDPSRWPEVGFCLVPPDDCIDYKAERGARWKR